MISTTTTNRKQVNSNGEKEEGQGREVLTPNGPDSKRPKPHFLGWIKRADWTLQNIEIARHFNVSPSSVSHARKRYGFPQPASKNKGRGRKAMDWGSVDWSYSDSGIALSLGCSRQSVHRARKIYAKQLKHINDLR